MNDTLKLQGRFKFECRDKDGNIRWTDDEWIPNIITYVGKAAVAGLAGNTGGITAFTYLAVGTSATAVAATDTALGAEISTNGLGRSAATVSRVTTSQTNDTLQLTFTWTATGTSTVQEVGVFNAASVGIILGHALTGAKTVNNTDQLAGTYQIQFS